MIGAHLEYYVSSSQLNMQQFKSQALSHNQLARHHLDGGSWAESDTHDNTTDSQTPNISRRNKEKFDLRLHFKRKENSFWFNA